MIKAKNIDQINVPSYPELNVKAFWRKIKSTTRYMKYFPDYKEGKLPERAYMFNVLNTIDPELVNEKIQLAEADKDVGKKLIEDEVIEVREDLLKEIESTSFMSSKILSLTLQ